MTMKPAGGWLQKAKTLHPQEWVLLGEAFFYLAWARVLVTVVPFNRLAPGLVRSGLQVTDSTRLLSARVGWAVRAAAARTPWPSTCLVQALAVKRMLQRRAIASTLYLGVARDGADGLKAHAWVRCQSAFLTGESGHEQYAVTAVFADAQS